MRTFSGIDHDSAAVSAGVCLVIGITAYFAVPDALTRYVVVLGAVAVLAAIGTRYELRVSTEGVAWSLLILWVVPVKRLRYLLDAKIDLYESFEATKPEGVCVKPVRPFGAERESPCFGPSFSQAAIARLHAQANDAIGEARSRLPNVGVDLRCELLAEDVTKLDVHRAKRNGQGRIREVEALEEIHVGPLLLSPGTILEFNIEDYLDPRREDCLVAVVTKTRLRLPMGIDVPPETRISVGPAGEIHAVRGALGPIDVDGFPIDGNAAIAFDAHGRLASFTLGAEMTMGGWPLAAGTTFSTWAAFLDQGPMWYCTLGGPLRLPELQLGSLDSVMFDKASKKLVRISPHREQQIDGWRLLARGPIGVDSEGRIDRRRAQKDGVLRR